MRILIVLFLVVPIVISCQSDDRQANFPKVKPYVSKLPKKENFWIFILAGQSNMAGRGLVSSEDTIPSFNILSIDSAFRWYLAKEPLHFYEPALTGLDCGLSFAREFGDALGDSIYVGLIPCAVGGSSIEQWMGDSLHRNVRLYTNFENKVNLSKDVGVIKGILWHQGENNAHPGMIKPLRGHLETLFRQFRTTVGNDSLPIVIGELSPFLRHKNGVYVDSVNQVFWQVKHADPNIEVIKTDDLTHKGDTLHFDAPSLRTLGQRYAEKYKLILKR